MKAKIVQYPFNEKKFEWDTQKQTKEFEYTWEQSEPNNYQTITPYLKTSSYEYDANKNYGYIDLNRGPNYTNSLNNDLVLLRNVPDTSVQYNKLTPFNETGYAENKRVCVMFTDGAYFGAVGPTTNDKLPNERLYPKELMHSELNWYHDSSSQVDSEPITSTYEGVCYRIKTENYNGRPIYRIELYSAGGPSSLNTGSSAWSLPNDYKIFVNSGKDPFDNCWKRLTTSETNNWEPFNGDTNNLSPETIYGIQEPYPVMYQNCGLTQIALRILHDNHLGGSSRSGYQYVGPSPTNRLTDYEIIRYLSDNSYESSKVISGKTNFYIVIYPMIYEINSNHVVDYQLICRRFFEIEYSVNNIPPYLPYNSRDMYNILSYVDELYEGEPQTLVLADTTYNYIDYPHMFPNNYKWYVDNAVYHEHSELTATNISIMVRDYPCYGQILNTYLKIDKRYIGQHLGYLTNKVIGNALILTISSNNLCGLTTKQFNYLVNTNASVGCIINFLNKTNYFNELPQWRNHNNISSYYRTISNNEIKIYDTNGIVFNTNEWDYTNNMNQYLSGVDSDYAYIQTTYNGSSWFEAGDVCILGNYGSGESIANNAYSCVDSIYEIKTYTQTQSTVLVDIDVWMSELNNEVSDYYYVERPTANYLALPVVKMIGDQTANSLTIPSGNTTIYAYTIGEPTDRTHLNPKPLLLNAPCEYDSQGNVVSRTWLTFNSYTAQQWANEYHFLGNQWNNIGSPWAYSGSMTTPGEHKMTLISYAACESGKYVNIFSICDESSTIVKDTNNNTFSVTSQTYYNNIGDLYYFDDDFVKSTDRNFYPDNGYKGRYYYRLKPEDTRFVAYHINPASDEITNVELFSDRYTYTHSLVDWADHSYENTVIGTPTSTNESSIPDAYYRTYKGIYYGQSIPLLNIAEIVIDPGMILGVPVYNKQINTSDTLKYGTVASASLTFRLDIPVDNAMVYNNKLLVAFYDFEHNGIWEPWGFFRIDTIEAQDENCTSIVAHDEVYKLNKYVDDFLKNYTGATTLDRFFKDLLDYCDCEYDPHMATINNGNLNLNNVYNATKTTGLEVAHYIANISPGFVHANMDNDIVLAQYKPTDKVKTVSDYSNLVYNAYNTDMLNKVIITMNNAVIAEDQGSGTKTYYIADNPLLSKHISEAALVLLAEKVLQKYQQIPVYRPAQIKFLTSPGIDIGDVFTVVTKNSQQYNVATMEININEGGLEIKSMGTATYPVDPSSNSQFVNLVDSIDTVQVDVDDLNDAVAGLDGRVGDVEDDIDALDGRIDTTESDISGLKTRMTTAEGNITSINGDISSLDSRVDDVEDGLVTVANSLATKIAADSISTANDLVTAKINGTTVSNIATKAYVDNSGGLGFTPAAFIAANISITGYTSITAWYIGRYNANVNMWNGLLVPLEKYAGYSLFQATTNGVLWGLSTSDGDWHIITNGSYSVRT